METVKIHPKTAFLVYDAWREPRRKNKSFDGLSNIGAYLLLDVCNRYGINIEFCSVDSANKYEVVLISFTSNYDVLAYAYEVGRHPDWQRGKRKFVTIGGGFGMQNPIPIKEWLDFAWFGRAENEIIDIILSKGKLKHESMLDLNSMKVCKLNQLNELYHYEIDLKTSDKKHNSYKEKIIGCPQKCFFCNYTWSRSYKKTSDHYNLSMYAGSQELDMFNIEDYNPKTAKLTVGLDGIDEQCRYFVNKKNIKRTL